MSLTEFDQEEYDRILRRDAYLEGKEDAARNALALGIPIDQVAKITGLAVEDIRALEAAPAPLTGRQRVSASQKLAGIADVTSHAWSCRNTPGANPMHFRYRLPSFTVR